MHEYFRDKHVLVTGGAGFVGSHLSETLVSNGARVLVVDSLLTGHQKNLHGVDAQFIQADVSQPVEQYLPSDFLPDAIFHLASPASPPKYQKYPIETYMVNSVGTHHLLQYLLRRRPDARFLFASTSEVYGDPLVHPQSESYWGNVNPNGPRSLYDESKRLGETICGVHTALGLDVRIVRIFNTYGPRIDIADGRVIPNLLAQALAGTPLTIYGDGSQTRSYCYVSDLVEGLLRMVETDGVSGETINLGNPQERTILETARIIHSLFAANASDDQVEKKLELEFLPLPTDDPRQRCPDITKAHQLLNWSPTVLFEDGLMRTVEYFRQLDLGTA